MTEPVAKRLNVTFHDGLPMGTRAEFTHDRQTWIAYPARKNDQILSVIDRLLGVHAGITEEMVRWINARPTDAELIARVLTRLAVARAVHDELVTEKTKARTS